MRSISIYKLLLSVFLFTISVPVLAFNNWSSMVCNGSDTTGRGVYLSTAYGSDVFNINGDLLRVVGLTRNRRGVVTENFIATNGMVVYDSIVPTSDYTLNLYQFNAVTDDLLAQASLTCGFSGNNPTQFKVIAQDIFITLQKK